VELGQDSQYSDYIVAWTTKEPWFDARYRQEIFLLPKAFSSGFETLSYSTCTGGSLPGDKAARV